MLPINKFFVFVALLLLLVAVAPTGGCTVRTKSDDKTLLHTSFLIGVHVGSRLRRSHLNINPTPLEIMADSLILADNPEYAKLIGLGSGN